MSDHANKDQEGTLKTLVGVLSLSTIGLLIATIVLAVGRGGSETAPAAAINTTDAPIATDGAVEVADSPCPAGPLPLEFDFLGLKSDSSFYNVLEANTCAGKKLDLANFPCTDLEVQPQAGANITKGHQGNHDVGELVPQTNHYFASGMCPVNVHWHLGTEHYSAGEFDENGDGPHGNVGRPEWAERARALAEGEVQDGFRCHHFDANEEKFTKPYEWKHCVGMEVGETYEVHWPHSSLGACGKVNQYQTPFYDGVFCNLPLETFQTLGPQDIASNVGVHGQIFTVVNDESYFYPDMIRGMIRDGDMGKDVTIYTGSTTGSTRSNDQCSTYSPITWQVDRKCHMISASSFDKMCFDMKMQRDDMSGDLYAHGSRELVHDDYAANNQVHNGDRQRQLADAVSTEMAGPSFLDLKVGSSMFSDLTANVCAGKKLDSPNQPCVDLEVAPQAGANVTKGYIGQHDVGDLVPNTKPFYQSKMCPVNVHWHLGTEHYSAGEYDENGNGPDGNVGRPEWAERARGLAEGEVQDGFRCHHYDESDEKFTKPYEWKHCVGMKVGETYEVHWPHSAFGACNTVNQYQTPFYDGVFCNLPLEVFQSVDGQTVANNVGVHGQIFTVVNDESYFYSDMIRGMVIDGDRAMGQDVTYYTGSTTGSTRSNEQCSTYSPITWQVDRKCHMISASSFDKMCYDMKMQRDDMSGDLYAHGSRELVNHGFSANNHVYPGDRKMLRG